jgi:hypothetical protein
MRSRPLFVLRTPIFSRATIWPRFRRVFDMVRKETSSPVLCLIGLQAEYSVKWLNDIERRARRLIQFSCRLANSPHLSWNCYYRHLSCKPVTLSRQVAPRHRCSCPASNSSRSEDGCPVAPFLPGDDVVVVSHSRAFPPVEIAHEWVTLRN